MKIKDIIDKVSEELGVIPATFEFKFNRLGDMVEAKVNFSMYK
jgi:hypothetical protein